MYKFQRLFSSPRLGERPFAISGSGEACWGRGVDDMDDMDLEAGEYDHYWETQMFFDAEELDSWGQDDAFSGSFDSSSPEGAASPETAKKSIAQERERRKSFNEKLYALRSLVPSITKMDKVSIVKDAIDYILQLQEEERKLLVDISRLEQEIALEKPDSEHPALPTQKGRKKSPSATSSEAPTRSTSINVTELKVAEVGDGTSIVTITCTRQKDTLARLCDVLDSLHLNILAANITTFLDSLIHTSFVDQAQEIGGTQLKQKIEAALAGSICSGDSKRAH